MLGKQKKKMTLREILAEKHRYYSLVVECMWKFDGKMVVLRTRSWRTDTVQYAIDLINASPHWSARLKRSLVGYGFASFGIERCLEITQTPFTSASESSASAPADLPTPEQILERQKSLYWDEVVAALANTKSQTIVRRTRYVRPEVVQYALDRLNAIEQQSARLKRRLVGYGFASAGIERHLVITRTPYLALPQNN